MRKSFFRRFAAAPLLAPLLLLFPICVPSAQAQRVLGTPTNERNQPAAQVQNAGGDFRSGDAVRVTIREEPELSGEFRVDENLMLNLGRLGTFSVANMSRAQLRTTVEERVRRVIRAPGSVVIQPLIRVAVLGSVGQPGFHQFPVTASLSDVLTTAGGPTQNADLGRVEINRGEARLIDRGRVSAAITQGQTLEQLGMRSGDRVDVGTRTQRDTWATLRTVGYAVGAVASIVRVVTWVF
ncbi:MAG: SLBB domain-containing protein [Gemmatimonadota bacterium]|nr:SLBB domain-containing protein [Gemmatimonadota bacterium]